MCRCLLLTVALRVAAARTVALALSLLVIPLAVLAVGPVADTVRVVHNGSAQFFAYGNPISGPDFAFTVDRDSLFINGVPAFPPLSNPSTRVPADLASIQHHDALQRAFALRDRLRAAGVAKAVVADSAATDLRANTSVIDSVTDHGSTLLVWWHDDRSPELVDLFGRRPEREVPIRQQCLDEAALYGMILQRGGILIVGRSAYALVQPADKQRALTDIAEARRGTLSRENWTTRTKHYLLFSLAEEIAHPMSLQAYGR